MWKVEDVSEEWSSCVLEDGKCLYKCFDKSAATILRIQFSSFLYSYSIRTEKRIRSKLERGQSR